MHWNHLPSKPNLVQPTSTTKLQMSALLI
uniref:Uncharacterized protein n=1 Tax=Moniliophthora roreri TaxID=221103 RepID=A0A0W0G0B6_MONRR